jgi:DNA-binding GntR family transcriptional regulator
MPARIHDVQTVSLIDAVCDAVRQSIISGDLGPGDPLTEQGVAEQFGVARTTAKAAVERLVAAGFLERSAHKTARVPVLTVDDVADLYETRIVLETDAVRRLAERREAPVDAEEAADDVIRHADAGNYERMASSDIAFHTALVDAAGVDRIARMHAVVMGETHLCMVQVQRSNPDDAGVSHAEHLAVLDAIRSGDSAAAQERMRAHLQRTRSEIVASLT